MLCDELGANYLTRARNEHAKAGNLNNGLAAFEGADRRRVRRRPRAVQIVPARDHRALLARSEALPRADAARLPQPRSGRAQPADLRPHAVGERDVLRGHPARPRQVERLVLLRLGRAAAARGARADRRLLRPHRHRGLRDGVRAASLRLDQRLCRQAAHRRPAARDLRVLHRPALALVPGHVPALPDEEPAVQARPQADPAASPTSRA